MIKKILFTLGILVPVAGQLSAYADYNGSNRMTTNTNQISDQQIKKELKDALKDGWFSAGYKNVSFTVNDGVVTLTGFVRDQDSIADIEDKVKNIEGVRLIKNQIAIRTDSQQNENTNGNNSYRQQNSNNQQSFNTTTNRRQNAFASDAEIKRAVNSELKDNWWGNYRNIRVDVNDGVVVLRGTVPNRSDVEDIEDRLGDIQGVRIIRTELQVQNQ